MTSKEEREFHFHLLGLEINNDQKKLTEIRRLYKESLRLPNTDYTNRRWYKELVRLVNRAWVDLRKHDTDLPPCAALLFGGPSDRRHYYMPIFEYTYAEEA